MPRDLGTDLTRAVLKPRGGPRGLPFITLMHAQLSVPVRVVGDVTKLDPATKAYIPYRGPDGKDYQCFMFRIALIPERDTPAQTTIELQNVDREIGLILKPLTDPITVSIAIYSSGDFAINAAGTRMDPVGTPTRRYWCPIASLRDVEWDMDNMQGNLRPFDFSLEMWPKKLLVPQTAPGHYVF